MKPAPFEVVTYQDAETKCSLRSDPKTTKTQIFSAAGEEILGFSEFLGRKKIFLSPDCQTLVVFGNYYFGTTINKNENHSVLDVYVSGKKQNQFTFQQVFGVSISEVIEKFQVPQRGGGWLSSTFFVTVTDVDWKQKRVNFKWKDEVAGFVSFTQNKSK